jgi:hypothetical protein
MDLHPRRVCARCVRSPQTPRRSVSRRGRGRGRGRGPSRAPHPNQGRSARHASAAIEMDRNRTAGIANALRVCRSGRAPIARGRTTGSCPKRASHLLDRRGSLLVLGGRHTPPSGDARSWRQAEARPAPRDQSSPCRASKALGHRRRTSARAGLRVYDVTHELPRSPVMPSRVSTSSERSV